MSVESGTKLQELHLQLPLGGIKGVQRKTLYDEVYNSFEGVPFAKPPIGALRFKAPEPVEPWTEERDCCEFSTIPTQLTGGSEDCLYLNVYTKTLNSVQPLPVMVYLYGGGFVKGDCTRAHYGPDYFMFENVVLVVPNYRLCALGFLSLSDPVLEVPGNAGLKDQILALQWVQKYIKYFNGDPNNVTLFGESAGAYSAHLLCCTAQTEALFHRAILLSASAFNYWGHAPADNAAYRLAKSYGYKGEVHDRSVLEYLTALPAESLVKHQLIDLHDIYDGKLFTFAPNVEPYECENSVFTKMPKDILKNIWSNNIPIIIGGTSFEGMVFNGLKPILGTNIDLLLTQPELLLPKEIKLAHTPKELKIMGQQLGELYFNVNAREKDEWLQILDLYSHKMFWHGIHQAVLSRLSNACAKTYMYLFDFDSSFFNLYRTKFMGSECRGVSHADELSYLFVLKDSFKLPTNTAEYQTIRRMVGLLTSFAAHGNPNCEQILPATWEPVTKEQPYKLLHIQNCVEMKDHPEKQRIEVWHKFYKNVPLI